MQTILKFRVDEGLALAAAMEVMRQVYKPTYTPVLVEIPMTYMDESGCWMITIFKGGGGPTGRTWTGKGRWDCKGSPTGRNWTVEVRLDSKGGPMKGWVRAFPPEFLMNRERGFLQAGLSVQLMGQLSTWSLKVETPYNVPIAELHWEELPENLRKDIPRWI